jgi:hypothetical protein
MQVFDPVALADDSDDEKYAEKQEMAKKHAEERERKEREAEEKRKEQLDADANEREKEVAKEVKSNMDNVIAKMQKELGKDLELKKKQTMLDKDMDDE